MIRLIRSEWLKIRRSVLWLLLVISPVLAGFIGYAETRGLDRTRDFPWIEALVIMTTLHAMLFLPLLTGVYSALLCRYEHAGGGWKQLLTLPVTRTQVYLVKFVFVMGLLAATQVLFLVVLLLVGWIQGGGGTIPWEELLLSIGLGWLACLPLAALQLAVSTAWSSFAAPLAVNVIFTIPNLLVANSKDYAPFYPWAQPLLAMMPRSGFDFGAFTLSSATLFTVIGVSFAVFFAGGWAYFSRKAV
ncbi:ABC transporter permease [Paenibacillus aurantius]|uniref:ABC transporter permease n=1 Tax=Paenibacillus aurantius TaxID=2918900 RepID=A0AA96LDN1_9BACL|nr:ABC transporter permease [Paenibacillus aurantius]WNQ11303.1 ABC transporter permease [Paenibacillus aurantius]